MDRDPRSKVDERVSISLAFLPFLAQWYLRTYELVHFDTSASGKGLFGGFLALPFSKGLFSFVLDPITCRRRALRHSSLEDEQEKRITHVRSQYQPKENNVETRHPRYCFDRIPVSISTFSTFLRIVATSPLLHANPCMLSISY